MTQHIFYILNTDSNNTMPLQVHASTLRKVTRLSLFFYIYNTDFNNTVLYNAATCFDPKVGPWLSIFFKFPTQTPIIQYRYMLRPCGRSNDSAYFFIPNTDSNNRNAKERGYNEVGPWLSIFFTLTDTKSNITHASTLRWSHDSAYFETPIIQCHSILRS